MRYLFIVLLLAYASVSAQNVNELPLFGEIQKSPEAIAADQRFVDSAVKSVGSKETAARMATFRGWQQLKQGDIDVAIQSFNQAYLLQPDNVEVYWGLGVAMTQQAKYDIAVRLFQRALVIEPDNARLLADVGLAHARAAIGTTQDPAEQTKRLEGALQWFNTAEKLDPNYAMIYANRAITLHLLGRYDESWANITKAQALDRASVDATLIADLTKKSPRPVLASTTPAPETVADTETVRTESVSAQSEVQPAKTSAPQPVAKEVMPKVPEEIRREPAQQTVVQAANQPATQARVEAAATQGSATEAPREAQMETVTAPAPQTEVRPIHATPTEATQAEPQIEVAPARRKKLRVISGQPAHSAGPDKRACLKLPTNEAIMRCVYPRK